MFKLTASMPQTAEAAGAYVYTVKSPSLDDYKVMVMVEAAGQGFYGALAEAAPTDAIRALLAKNGQEELAHAHRVSRVIKKLYGEDFAVPAPEENPYYRMPQGLTVTKEMLDTISQADRRRSLVRGLGRGAEG